MNVLITGGTGFIGSRLALQCLEDGCRVRIYAQENTPAEVQNCRALEIAGAEIQRGSITDKKQVAQAVRSMDVIYHLAAAQHEANVPDALFWEANLQGTQNILAAGAAAGIRRLVHGSTIGVYGSAMGGVIDENSPLKPDNIYGVTKLEGERAVLAYKEQLPVTVIRISETYGPGDRRLLKLFRGVDRRTFPLIGSGDNIHHLIYVQDLIDGMQVAASSPEALGEVFVLSGRQPLTTTEMVRTICQELNKPLPPLRLPLMPMTMVATAMELTLRPLGIQPPLHRRRMDFFKKSFLFSQEKATQKLGFSPAVTFRRGVAETARWYRKEGLL